MFTIEENKLGLGFVYTLEFTLDGGIARIQGSEHQLRIQHPHHSTEYYRNSCLERMHDEMLKMLGDYFFHATKNYTPIKGSSCLD